MTNIPSDLKFAKSMNGCASASPATVGISDHAQAELADIVFLEYLQPARSACAVVESVKTADDILFARQRNCGDYPSPTIPVGEHRASRRRLVFQVRLANRRAE